MSQGYFTKKGSLVGEAWKQGYCGAPNPHRAHTYPEAQPAIKGSQFLSVACSGSRLERLVSAAERHGFPVKDPFSAAEPRLGFWARLRAALMNNRKATR